MGSAALKANARAFTYTSLYFNGLQNWHGSCLAIGIGRSPSDQMKKEPAMTTTFAKIQALTATLLSASTLLFLALA